MQKRLYNLTTVLLVVFSIYATLQFKGCRDSGVPATLPDNIKHETVIKDSKVIVTQRVTNKVTGQEKIKQDVKYLPPEGKATVSVDLEGEAKVILDNKGFTFTPGAFFLAGQDMNVGLGARLVYWNRFGAGAGISMNFSDNESVEPFAFADMRLANIGMNNAALGLFVKPKGIGVSLAVYFK
ncbi:hypothetical protein Dip510_000817 [Elusimicrobium posterum]|uniref:hypothetical protein n=1 Tax=Elusimicrobium posterum TaxID=3116653 RepID=UPI003C78D1F6